ncbi:MAG: phosphoadenylyl-sulfate reductase [Rhizomicrobium sp.]|jgi:phosphoadenosine phosphosulfate reductase
MNAVTVIEQGRVHRIFDRAAAFQAEPQSRSRLAALRAAAEGRDAYGVLSLALREAPTGQTAIVSSFGSESAVLLHMVAQIEPTTPILFLNTGKLFGETLRYRDRLQDLLGLTDIRAIGPHPIERLERDPDGVLWSQNPDACCSVRKVVPMRRALEGFGAYITGRKRFQTDARAEMNSVEIFEGRFRFNPLAEWSLAGIEAYFLKHSLPRHPLVEDGYPSIGCLPCTRRVQKSESYRDGRWAGLEKDECGIHTGLDGEGI